MSSIAVLALLVIAAAGGYVWWLNHQIGNIQRFSVGITPETPHVSGGKTIQPLPEKKRALNVLLLGADNGSDTLTVAQELARGTWTPGAHRSDTIMVVHISANRRSVQLVSIPRDTWVPVPGYVGDVNGYAKINAAFSWGGPKLTLQVVQKLTGIHIDHVAIIDWKGFKDLTNAVGGVRIYIPHTFYDDSQKVTWTKGWHIFDGYHALQYVRTRHGLAGGDLDRIKRQQNFLRTLMQKVLSNGTLENPIKITKVIGVVTQYVSLDNTWSNSEVRDFALGLRNLRASGVKFTTAPVQGGATIDGQDVIKLDTVKAKEVWKDLKAGKLGSYLQQNPGSQLASDTSVN